MTPDNELLGRYAKSGSEDAFAELVRRYVGLVYSAALRQVGGDAHLAQDVAQTVFTDLARKARSLSCRKSLSGWLYTSAHFAAAKIARTEHRRRNREEKFMREPTHENRPEADWDKLRPALDAAMHELKESDREAVLLRYFQNESFAEVGVKLNLNENAARMRVERALEKLRDILARQGITTSAVFATAISANAVHAAPAGLASILTSASTAAAGTGTLALFKFMTATKLKIGLGVMGATAVAVAFVMQHQAQTAMRAKNESLSQQVVQLKNDNSDLSNRLSASGNSQPLTGDQFDELLKLRAEVTRLRAMKAAPAAASMPVTNNVSATKKIQIHLKTRFVSIESRLMPTFGAGWMSAGPDTSLLSEQQFAVVLAAARNKEINLFTAPQVITLNGSPADVSITKPARIAGTNANIGAMLDVLPYYSPGSSTFTLDLAAKLNQLTGDPSQPDIQTVQASNQVNLFPGQTVALKADIPPGSWLPDSTNLSDGQQSLLVFVTPTLVDFGGKPQSSESKTMPDAALQKLTDAKQGMIAVLMFANDNQNLYPTNLAQASHYLNNGYMDQIASDFDLLAPASLTNITNASSTIVLREKQAWQTQFGTWAKTYGFADGHSEVHAEPTDNFDDFEKDRIVSAPSAQ